VTSGSLAVLVRVTGDRRDESTMTPVVIPYFSSLGSWPGMSGRSPGRRPPRNRIPRMGHTAEVARIAAPPLSNTPCAPGSAPSPWSSRSPDQRFQFHQRVPAGCAHLDEHSGAQVCYQMSAREQIREPYAT
jgi:hypothetical protein